MMQTEVSSAKFQILLSQMLHKETPLDKTPKRPYFNEDSSDGATIETRRDAVLAWGPQLGAIPQRG
jgi:hypothetical protein